MSKPKVQHEWKEDGEFASRRLLDGDHGMLVYDSGLVEYTLEDPVSDDLAREILRLSAELARATVPDNWTPTAENVNGLPDQVRGYIHDLATRCDPSGDVQRLALAEDTARALHAENEEMRSEAARAREEGWAEGRLEGIKESILDIRGVHPRTAAVNACGEHATASEIGAAEYTQGAIERAVNRRLAAAERELEQGRTGDG